MKEYTTEEKMAAELLYLTAKQMSHLMADEPEYSRMRQAVYDVSIGDAGQKVQVQIAVTNVEEDFLEDFVIEKHIKKSE